MRRGGRIFYLWKNGGMSWIRSWLGDVPVGRIFYCDEFNSVF